MANRDQALHGIQAHCRAGRYEEALALARSAAADRPHEPALLGLAGTIAGQLGHGVESLRLLEAAANAAPKAPHVHYNLAVALTGAGKVERAAAAFERSIALDPSNRDAWFGLAHARLDRADRAGALEAFRQVLAVAADDPAARHMVAALSGETTEGAPTEYVRGLFEDYAPRFEADMAGPLAYAIPDAIVGILEGLAPSCRAPGDAPWARALDLGCGTGLCGARIRHLATRLEGVDLSPAMVARAREKALYDDLWAGDMMAFLDRATAAGRRYDLVTAADVMVYVGNLEPVVEAVAACLAAAGIFAFSVESTDRNPYALQTSGRFAHADSYVAEMAARSGLGIRAVRATVLRRDAKEPVAGTVWATGPKKEPNP